jgi:8-oxo-dGTP diphosphatase
MSDVVEHPRRQRIGAYALLTREGDRGETEVLLTRMSARTRIEGRWTLPGGGIDHGEDPREAMVREVHEETGLYVEPGEVLDIHSTHFVGPRHDGTVEDYHGVHLIFSATIRPESVGADLRVLEHNSSTEESRWVPLSEARSYELLSAASHALGLLS